MPPADPKLEITLIHPDGRRVIGQDLRRLMDEQEVFKLVVRYGEAVDLVDACVTNVDMTYDDRGITITGRGITEPDGEFEVCAQGMLDTAEVTSISRQGFRQTTIRQPAIVNDPDRWIAELDNVAQRLSTERRRARARVPSVLPSPPVDRPISPIPTVSIPAPVVAAPLVGQTAERVVIDDPHVAEPVYEGRAPLDMDDKAPKTSDDQDSGMSERYKNMELD